MATRPANCCKAADYSPRAFPLCPFLPPSHQQNPMPLIRPSQSTDLAAITAIYGHHVLHGTGTFETEPPSLADMTHRRADVLSKNLPYLVAEEDGVVLGFAYCNWFKPRPAYRFSAEDSIYLAPGSEGKGLGRALLQSLSASAEAVGVRKLIAVIGDSQNHGSIGVHRAAGFERVGVLKACGWKFDRWLDVVLMEKVLGEGDSTSPNGASESVQ
jgi:L-amino acid N-acyltransferase YncA